MKKRIYILLLIVTIVETHNCASLHAQSSLTPAVLSAYNWLKYEKNNARSTGDFDIGFGLTYRHQFKNNFQLAIGVNYRKYYGNIDFNGMRDSIRLTEFSEGHNYFLHQVFNSTEQQSVTYIEPNIRLEYVLPLISVAERSRGIDFIAGIGLVYDINFAETNEMTGGSFRRYAWFYENNNLIENLPSMGLGTFTNFQNPSQDEVFRHSLFALGEVGFRFRLSQNWSLLTMLVAQHSLLNIQNQPYDFISHDSYHGIAASDIPKGVRGISLGLELGLTYHFTKSQTSARSSAGKRPQMPGYCPAFKPNRSKNQTPIFNKP
jgi:hypothetical protein